MKRIILLGLPKCGTLSFYQALTNSGYKAGHWINEEGQYLGELIMKAHARKKPLLEFIPEYEAITQMDYISSAENKFIFPQVYLYKDFLQQYPDALFILNYRHIENHVDSIKAWPDLYHRFKYFGITNLEAFIENHHANIRKHFGGKENFMQVDIERTNDKAISQFIGYDFTMCHRNKTIPK